MAGFWELLRLIAEFLETARQKGAVMQFTRANGSWAQGCLPFHVRTAPFWAAYGRVEGEKWPNIYLENSTWPGCIPAFNGGK
jgi:hypothetical protein